MKYEHNAKIEMNTPEMLRLWGLKPQLLMVLEELAELSIEISELVKNVITVNNDQTQLAYLELQQINIRAKQSKKACKMIRKQQFFGTVLDPQQLLSECLNPNTNKLARAKICDEIADVEIMLCQLKEIGNFKDLVEDRINFKLFRLDEKLINARAEKINGTSNK